VICWIALKITNGVDFGDTSQNEAFGPNVYLCPDLYKGGRYMCGVIQRGFFVTLCLLLTASAVSAQKYNPDMMKLGARCDDAAKVFDEIMAAPDNAVPKDLLDKAEAIAIFPGVVKAAFVVGGQGGRVS
jgi:hypothetical protein